jgi:RNA polymerase sigma-54 factor
MNAIMHYQEEFFIDGDETKLKPMILKDIADLVGLDISTISRVETASMLRNSLWNQELKSSSQKR